MGDGHRTTFVVSHWRSVAILQGLTSRHLVIMRMHRAVDQIHSEENHIWSSRKLLYKENNWKLVKIKRVSQKRLYNRKSREGSRQGQVKGDESPGAESSAMTYNHRSCHTYRIMWC